MKSRAAVAWAAGQPLEVTEIDVDGPRAGEVLVRIIATGVCHTDAFTLSGDDPEGVFPSVLGHEGGGVVEEVGAGVTSVKVGDHVIPLYTAECRKCKFCLSGKTNLCQAVRATQGKGLMPDGTTRFSHNGKPLFHYMGTSTFSEYTVVPEISLAVINKAAPLEKVCLLGCGVTTGIGAVLNTAKVAPGSSVAVFGCGGVGLNAIQAAALMGAGKIIAVDVFDAKLQGAEEFGATHLVNAATEDAVARIHAICGRGGADYAIEVVGGAKTIEQAFMSVHRGGTVVIVGLSPAGTRISIDPAMVLQERVLTGSSFGGSRQRVDLPMFVDLFMDGRYKLRELISREIELEDLNAAYEALERGEVRRSVVRYQ
jgi:S-(hydroxymethyl)glutathione dehydrogenase/alcohol dehydrogenase